MTNINLTPVFQALIALLAALITYRVIPWIKSRTTLNQRMELATAAKIAVFAAEQIYGKDKDANDKKLEYAIERLKEAGFDMDALALREAIEAAVYDIKSSAIPRFLDFRGDMDKSEVPEDPWNNQSTTEEPDADHEDDGDENDPSGDEPDEDVDGD